MTILDSDADDDVKIVVKVMITKENYVVLKIGQCVRDGVEKITINHTFHSVTHSHST